MDADRSTTGPLTWTWMLVVFAMATTLSTRAAGIFVGGGAAALLGAAAGLAATAAIYYLWASLKGNVAAKVFVAATVIIGAGVSAVVVRAAHELRQEARRPAPAAQQSTPEIVDPFKQAAADVPLAEAEWNTAINAWQARNAAFLADPARRDAMDAAVQELDRSSPGLSDAELIRRAEALAFARTGWR